MKESKKRSTSNRKLTKAGEPAVPYVIEYLVKREEQDIKNFVKKVRSKRVTPSDPRIIEKFVIRRGKAVPVYAKSASNKAKKKAESARQTKDEVSRVANK